MSKHLRAILIFLVPIGGVPVEVVGAGILWAYVHPAVAILWMALMTIAIFGGEFALTL